jgi:hypothetical protein
VDFVFKGVTLLNGEQASVSTFNWSTEGVASMKSIID